MDNIGIIAQHVVNAAMDKARELGEENIMASSFEAICCAKTAIKKMAILYVILGPERMEQLGELLIQKEVEDAVNEAEDVLKEADD